MNGQTIKTRMLSESLVRVLGSSAVEVLDTSSALRNPVRFYWRARQRFADATQIIVVPGPRGVHVLLSLFLRWRKRQHKDIRYVVIGGFLPDFVEKHSTLRDVCSQLDGIYVETQSMADRLTQLGLGNVTVLPNFRLFDLQMTRSYEPACKPLRLVFCARIFKEKGIEEAIEAVNRLNTQSDAPVAALDVYGPIDDSYKRRLAELLENSQGSRYLGVLATSRIYNVLQRYDLMLFPTYYYGEGFPGSILDAFIAGVPVVASDWAYNSEIVEHGRTGAICRARSSEDLAEAVRRYVDTPFLLAEMRQHCIARARQYHADEALKPLLTDIGAGVDRSGRFSSPSNASCPQALRS
jgi:glycosyltransferase involved in cell wall biosynthesis